VRLFDDVQKKLAELIMHYYYQFEDDIKDIRPMLSAISSFKDLDPGKFSWGVSRILNHSAYLSRAEFEEIHNELQGALTVVAGYFGQQDAAPLANRLTRGDGWDGFWSLSYTCIKLAEVDKGLFSPEIVDSLEHFLLLCPYHNYWNQGLRENMKALRELTGLPPHPEVAPAADSQSSSATDS